MSRWAKGLNPELTYLWKWLDSLPLVHVCLCTPYWVYRCIYNFMRLDGSPVNTSMNGTRQCQTDAGCFCPGMSRIPRLQAWSWGLEGAATQVGCRQVKGEYTFYYLKSALFLNTEPSSLGVACLPSNKDHVIGNWLSCLCLEGFPSTWPWHLCHFLIHFPPGTLYFFLYFIFQLLSACLLCV